VTYSWQCHCAGGQCFGTTLQASCAFECCNRVRLKIQPLRANIQIGLLGPHVDSGCRSPQTHIMSLGEVVTNFTLMQQWIPHRPISSIETGHLNKELFGKLLASVLISLLLGLDICLGPGGGGVP
jgi:hypothetical protein